MTRQESKVCLVLGGGGARGLAHLGVLQVLEREDIHVDCIIGTSVGAIVGAAYVMTPDAFGETRRALAYLASDAFASNPFKKVFIKSDDVEQNFLSSFMSSIKKGYTFSALLRKRSIFPSEKLYQVIEDLVPDRAFEEAHIPFAVPALDLDNGEEVLLTHGDLRKAVLASCSLPGFFPPVEHQGRLLVDAGVIGPVPVSAAIEHFQPTTVIAVDIGSGIEKRSDPLGSGLEIILKVEAIASSRLNALELEKADIVIQPRVGTRAWSDFSGLAEIVTEGILATEPKIAAIRAAIERPRKRSFFRSPITFGFR